MKRAVGKNSYIVTDHGVMRAEDLTQDSMILIWDGKEFRFKYMDGLYSLRAPIAEFKLYTGMKFKAGKGTLGLEYVTSALGWLLKVRHSNDNLSIQEATSYGLSQEGIPSEQLLQSSWGTIVVYLLGQATIKGNLMSGLILRTREKEKAVETYILLRGLGLMSALSENEIQMSSGDYFGDNYSSLNLFQVNDQRKITVKEYEVWMINQSSVDRLRKLLSLIFNEKISRETVSQIEWVRTDDDIEKRIEYGDFFDIFTGREKLLDIESIGEEQSIVINSDKPIVNGFILF